MYKRSNIMYAAALIAVTLYELAKNSLSDLNQIYALTAVLIFFTAFFTCYYLDYKKYGCRKTIGVISWISFVGTILWILGSKVFINHAVQPYLLMTVISVMVLSVVFQLRRTNDSSAGLKSNM